MSTNDINPNTSTNTNPGNSTTTTDGTGLGPSNFWAWVLLLLMIALTGLFIREIVTKFHEVMPREKITARSVNDFVKKFETQAVDTSKVPADTSAKGKTLVAPKRNFVIPSDSVKSFLGQGDVDKNSEEARQYALLWLVACCGGLGSMIYILSSFTSFWGDHKLYKIWFPWYLAKPVVGMALAVVGFLVLRAGFLTGSNIGDINIYGLLAFSCFMGLFSDDATIKLKEVFDVLFKPADSRSGKLDSKPAVTGLDPKSTKPGSSVEITLSGTNFTSGLVVKCNNTPVTITQQTATTIKFQYTPLATDAPAITITVSDAGKDIYTGKITVTT